MVGFSKKRKSSKRRGTREHGRGRKKGRGAGLRGGRGNAGRHKHKRVHYEQLGEVWGKHGFKRPEEAVNVVLTLNVSDLDKHIDGWVSEGKAEKVDGGYSLDLAAVGFDKLLGAGQVRNAYKLKAVAATPSAVSKIEDAGGQVDVQGAA